MTGSSTTTVVSTDVETQKSMCRFTLISETETPSKVFEWQDNLDSNVVTAIDSDGNTYTFNKAITCIFNSNRHLTKRLYSLHVQKISKNDI